MSELMESAWSKGRSEPMTKEEAAYIWTRTHAMAKAYPDGDRLLWLFGRLERELVEGIRCGVCGRHGDEDDNYNCAIDC